MGDLEEYKDMWGPIDKGSRIGHFGFNIGYHGKIPFKEIDPETREFLDKLTKAADENGYIVHRVFLSDKPLKTAIIEGELDKKAKPLIEKLATNEDLVLTDNKGKVFINWTKEEVEKCKYLRQKAQEDGLSEIEAHAIAEDVVIKKKLSGEFPQAKEARYNGSRSQHGLVDVELLGPYRGSISDDAKFMAKQTISFANNGKFDKVYQHCNIYEHAFLSEGRPHTVNGGPQTETTYDRTLPSELESAGLSYAVLVPKISGSHFDQEEYADDLISTAKLKLEDIVDKLEK